MEVGGLLSGPGVPMSVQHSDELDPFSEMPGPEGLRILKCLHTCVLSYLEDENCT